MTQHVLILGAGALGLSSALHLLSSGRYRITVLERHPSGLSPSAASSDRNKIVRCDYPDLAYAKLAREAVGLWKGEEWEGCYHEFPGVLMESRTGVLVIGDHSPTGQYTHASLANSLALGCRIVPASSPALHDCFPAGAPIPVFEPEGAFVNRDGGWVEATRAMHLLRARVESLGGRVLGGKEVAALSYDGEGQVDGAVLAGGEVLRGDLVLLATGAWTPSLFPRLAGGRLLATGQSELFLRLEGEERGRWRGSPVVLDWSTGMSVFEPDEEGIVKVAIHHAGYVNPQVYTAEGKEYRISTPRTSEEGEIDKPAVPVEVVKQLRDWLRLRFPSLGEKPFVGSRLCWKGRYTDTPDGDWLIDFCPGQKRLLFVTGGSGHAFKNNADAEQFLPNIGSLVLQRMEGTLQPQWASKLAWEKGEGKDMSRVGERTEILRAQVSSMDQSAFRNMLGRPGASSSAPSARPRNIITGQAGAKPSQAPAKEAAFKPRKVKDAPKLVSSEVERRDDKGALDEIAQMIDSLRSGGPSSSGPAAGEDLDASLEAAFETAKPDPPAPVAGRKRTREDIVRELREKKGAGESPDAAKEGTGGSAPVAKGFKPIGKKAEGGFKPIGEKKKKKKVKITEEKAELPAPRTEETDAPQQPAEPARVPEPPIPAEPDVDMEEDIFAGAGMFEGYDISDEEGEAPEGSKPPPDTAEPAAPPPARANWFNEPSRSPSPPPAPPTPPPQDAVDEEEEEGEMRLRPLESSSIPSIRELLTMDKEEENRAKRRMKKDAWRAKQGLAPSERDGNEWSDEEERKKKKKKKGLGLESEYNK
ncbi:DAO-domain-containing protein [Calocera viscosa TUFC12733]|uniref:DAO-domain-containing protein n=1 Tax=Calocera viscosa (strain TUFC12733) TaxID=1330018 RepID=A0A167RYD0_CALVF|nr:DAO-domain-containing protein [Calocera viscosa TUFC12733]